MDFQTISVNVKTDIVIPTTLRSHTADDNYIMLLVGCHAVSTMKQNFVDLNAQEYKTMFEQQLYSKTLELGTLKAYFEESMANERQRRDDIVDTKVRDTIHKCNLDIEVYRKTISSFTEDKIEMMKRMQEQIDQEREIMQCKSECLSQTLTDKLNAAEKEVVSSKALVSNMEKIIDLRISEEVLKKMDSYKEKLNSMERSHLQFENKRVQEAESELEQVKRKLSDTVFTFDRFKFDCLNKEYVNQAKLVQEMAALLESNKKSSSAGLGQEGEFYFRELADQTFENYDHYELTDKRKSPHSGDFFLRFRSFTIMADVKLFKRGTISTTDRNKLTRDMDVNRDIHVAWMVSLEGGVANFNKHPFEVEIENGRLFVYINDLKNAKDPIELLKSAWYVSQFVYDNILMNESQATLLNKYKKYHIRIKENLTKMLKLSKDRSDMMVKMTENHVESERIMKNCIHDEIVNIRELHQEVVETWWAENTVIKEQSQMKTKNVYEKFILTNAEHGISHDAFKMLLKNVVGEDHLNIGKTGKGQFTIQGYKMSDSV